MKRKLAVLLSGTLVVSALSLCVSASEDVSTETIGNLTFEIPSDWSMVSNEESDSGNITVSYLGDTMGLAVTYMEMGLGDIDESLQRIFFDTVLETFESEDGYNEMTNDDYDFEGYAGNSRMFTYNSDGTNTLALTNAVYTGEGIALFVLGVPSLEASDTIIDTYSDIVESTKITEGSSETTDTSSDLTEYSSGIYKVGVDIPAGEYILYASGGTGYFCVSSDSNQSDITFNDNFEYNSIITVNDGEYLDLTRCYAVPSNEDPEVDTTSSGMFKVGTHIPAGEYKIEATDGMGYYCIYPDSRQEDIVANDNFEGQNYVTVTDGQYLVLNRCKFSEPPEKPVKTYTDSSTIQSVQEKLNSLGYDCGTPDGIAGDGTRSAIEKYQSDNSLSVTGTITDELISSLGL